MLRIESEFQVHDLERDFMSPSPARSSLIQSWVSWKGLVYFLSSFTGSQRIRNCQEIDGPLSLLIHALEVRQMSVPSLRHNVDLLQFCYLKKKKTVSCLPENCHSPCVSILYLRVGCSVLKWQRDTLAPAPRVGLHVISRASDHLHWPAPGGQDTCHCFPVVAAAARWVAALSDFLVTSNL